MNYNDTIQESSQPSTSTLIPLTAGRRRKWARFDLPVIRPSTTLAQLARKLV